MAANDGMNASGNANENAQRPVQMAQANSPIVSAGAAGPNTIHVTPPAPGAREEITVLPGQTVVLDGVDLATSRVERTEGGLLITLADGGVIFLAGFVEAAGSANPPTVEIPGLGALEATQLLAAADANVSNIQPAAGPGAGGPGGGDAAHGGGANFGDVAPGSIGDGLGRQTLLGPTDFNRGAPEPTFVFGPVPQDANAVASVTFDISSTPGSVPEQSGWILFGEGSERGPAIGHYTVDLTGTLPSGQTASVVLNSGGTATTGVDYGSTGSPSANFDTIVGSAVGGVHVGNTWTNAATGISYNGDTNTLTFTGGGATTLTFNMVPVDDNIVEGTETATVTLSGATADTGTANIGIGSATVNIIDNDTAIFDISATPASISEQNGPSATFTVQLDGNPLATGNTASVVVTPSGSATNGTDYTAIDTAIATAIAGLPGGSGVSYNAGTHTLTFTGGGASSLSFTVTAVNDALVEGTEHIVLSLSGASVAAGSVTIGTNSATVDITENNAPTANPDANTVNEDTVTAITGNVLTNDTDPDAGDTLHVSAVAGGTVGGTITGSHGTVTIGADGIYSYLLNNADPAVQALAVGQTLTDTFTYTASDTGGLTSSSTLTLTIHGTNDAPITVADVNAVTESGVHPGNTAFPGTPSTNGNVLTNDTDVDSGDTHTVSAVNGAGAKVGVAVAGTYGSVTINSDGTYTYTLDNTNPATNALAQGATVTDQFTYTNSDNNGGTSSSTLTITITGTNDAPIAIADVNAVSESGVNPGNTAFAGTPTATGNVLTNDTDVDTGDTHTVTAVTGGTVGSALAGTYGSVTINSNGTYTYTLDNNNAATNALAQGASVTDQFTYTNTDNNGATSTSTLTITITGTNDAPVAIADVGSVTESGVNPGNTPFAGTPSATGNVLTNDTDVDTGDSKSVSAITGGTVGTAKAGTYGSVTINADGTYSYTLDNASTVVNALPQGATVTDQFTYTVQDSHGATSSSTLTITVHGTNDGPVAIADVNSIGSGAVVPVTGNVLTNDTDVDTGDTHSVSAVNGAGAKVGVGVAGSFGTVTINANGIYSYTVDNTNTTVNTLAAGQQVTDQFTYTNSDNNGATSSSTLTITITGTNFAPVAVADTGSVTESGVNPGNTAFPGTPTNSGSVLTNDTDANVGDTHSVTAVNGAGANVGSAIAGTYGSVTINADGTYTYTLNNGSLIVNALAQGATVTDQFTYTNTDNHGASSSSTLTITIHGTNDAPVATADINSVVESGVNPGNTAFAGTPTATGNVLTNDTDVDTGDTLHVSAITGGTVGTAKGGTYGSVVLNANGTYTYTLDNTLTATNALAQGATANDVFTYTVQDANGATSQTTLTITVTGTNDAPTAVADTGSVTESGVNPGNTVFGGTPTATGNVLSNDTDVDTGDTKTVSAISGGTLGTSLAGTYGSVVLNANGTYTYTLDNTLTATNALAQGATANDVFTYTVQDANGATSSTTLTITVHGTNDAPIAVADTNTAVEAGVNPGNTAFAGTPTATGNVLTNDTDVDTGDTKSVSAISGGTVGTSLAGTYGSVVINANGTYTYTLDNTLTATNALAQGATANDVFTYTVQDANGATSQATLTIGVTGTNDAPVLDLDANNSSGATGTGYQTTYTTVGAHVNIADVDTTITDPDTGATITGATITLTNHPDGAAESLSILGGLPAGITATAYNSTTGVLTLSGSASLSAYQTAIDQIQYADTSANANQTDRTVTVVVTDDHGATSTATSTIVFNQPNILDGTLTTNSNSSSQLITLTFAEVQHLTDTNWHHAASKIYDLSAQGQQGSVLQDVGFNISTTNQYEVGLEATSGTKAIISALTLEQEAIKPAGGNEQLQLDNTSATNSTETAFTAIITPSTTINQGLTVSQDGSGAGETINDTVAGFSYIYGADGTDNLTATTNQPTLFNGGAGADSITGGSGNDIIVYDPADHVNGGAGIDLLRVDQGAITLTGLGSGNDLNTLNASNDVPVDLRSKDIHNIEGILITEEAGKDNGAVGTNPNDDVGTKVILDAASVIAYSSNNTLAVLGSAGDVLDLGSTDHWVQGASATDAQNQTMVTYTSTVGAVTATLVVDAQVQVIHA